MRNLVIVLATSIAVLLTGYPTMGGECITKECKTVGELKQALEDIADDTQFYLDGDEFHDHIVITYYEGRLYIEMEGCDCE